MTYFHDRFEAAASRLDLILDALERGTNCGEPLRPFERLRCYNKQWSGNQVYLENAHIEVIEYEA